jgi:hypothetical protein
MKFSIKNKNKNKINKNLDRIINLGISPSLRVSKIKLKDQGTSLISKFKDCFSFYL